MVSHCQHAHTMIISGTPQWMTTPPPPFDIGSFPHNDWYSEPLISTYHPSCSFERGWSRADDGATTGDKGWMGSGSHGASLLFA